MFHQGFSNGLSQGGVFMLPCGVVSRIIQPGDALWKDAHTRLWVDEVVLSSGKTIVASDKTFTTHQGQNAIAVWGRTEHVPAPSRAGTKNHQSPLSHHFDSLPEEGLSLLTGYWLYEPHSIHPRIHSKIVSDELCRINLQAELPLHGRKPPEFHYRALIYPISDELFAIDDNCQHLCSKRGQRAVLLASDIDDVFMAAGMTMLLHRNGSIVAHLNGARVQEVAETCGLNIKRPEQKWRGRRRRGETEGPDEGDERLI